MSFLYDIPRQFIIGLAETGKIHYTFSFAFVVNGFLCAIVVGPLLGAMGTMVVVKRMAFFSQAVGNAALTGVAIGVIIGESYTAPYVSMFSFCLLFGLLLNFARNHTKMSSDTLIGVFLSISLAIGATALLWVSAKVQVPFWPVPMTMQTFVVLGIGAAYGARLAGITVLTYLAQGAMGLPVFATGTGLAYLAGPTGGYLAGFFVAAVVVGYLADEGLGRTHLSAFLVFLAATLLIFGLGAAWLALLIGPAKAFTAGVLPFLPAEAAKLLLATAFFPIAWRLARD